MQWYHIISYHTSSIIPSWYLQVLRAVNLAQCNWLTGQRLEETSSFPSASYKLKNGQFGQKSGPAGATDLEEACLCGREKGAKRNRWGEKGRIYEKESGSVEEEEKMERMSTKYKVKGPWKGAEQPKVSCFNISDFCVQPFKRQVKFHLPSAGIIRNSPYSPR